MESVTLLPAAAGLSLAVWVYLLLARGGFWRARERLDAPTATCDDWPGVVAVIPARDEAEVIETALGSVLAQDYPGPFQVVLVDDQSRDATAEIALRTAARLGRERRLASVRSRPLPPGWSGKLWALSQGVERAGELAPAARYIWLTDADIAHEPGNLRALVAKAERDRLDLVSQMAVLSMDGFWERLLIPPFVFFFQKLYPFAWVNDPNRQTAAAAGGCVLVHRAALEAAGRFAAIRGALIDDCALAREVKHAARARGRGIWLGLTTAAKSIRPYAGVGPIWDMVARTAYTQLGHSPVLLVGTVAGMVVTYLVPPLTVLTLPLHGEAAAALAGLSAWALMALAAWPTLRLYRQPPGRALLLPLAALLYTGMTVASAVRHWRGRGGLWKGRVQASARGVAGRAAGR